METLSRFIVGLFGGLESHTRENRRMNVRELLILITIVVRVTYKQLTNSSMLLDMSYTGCGTYRKMITTIIGITKIDNNGIRPTRAHTHPGADDRETSF